MSISLESEWLDSIEGETQQSIAPSQVVESTMKYKYPPPSSSGGGSPDEQDSWSRASNNPTHAKSKQDAGELQTLDTFTYFGKLLPELRLTVWEHARDHPRTIKIDRVGSEKGSRDYAHFTIELVNPILHVNCESREVGLRAYEVCSMPQLNIWHNSPPLLFYFNSRVDTLELSPSAAVHIFNDLVQTMVRPKYSPSPAEIQFWETFRRLTIVIRYRPSPEARYVGAIDCAARFPNLEELTVVYQRTEEEKKGLDVQSAVKVWDEAARLDDRRTLEGRWRQLESDRTAESLAITYELR